MHKTKTKISAAIVALIFSVAAQAQVADTLDIKRTLQLKSPLGNSALPGELRIFEAANSGSQRIKFRAPVSMPVNVNLVLPITQPSTGNVLTALTSDSLGWSTPSGTGDITGVTAGVGLAGGGSDGDVTLDVIYAATAGNADTLTLHDFITGAPSMEDFIKWNGANWVPAAGGGAGDIEGVTAGTGLSGGGTSGTVTLSADSTSWLATDFNVSLRQLKSDTATYDATKSWVLGKSYLVASDIAGKQDDSDTLTFDATKTYVNTRGFLTTETGDISEVVAGNGLAGGGITGSVTIDLNPKLTGQTIAITSDSAHVKTASLDSSHVKALGIAGSDIAAATITGGKIVTNTLGPTQIDETAIYNFSSANNIVRALSLRPDTLALRGAVTVTSVNDTVVFRKANGGLAFKIYTGASPTTDQILKANGDKVLVFGADVSGGGGGGGSFRVRDDGSSISSTPQSLDFRAGLQAIAAGTDSLEIYIAANRGIKAATDTLQILRTLNLSGLAFKSDSVMVDTASVVIQTKTEVAAQITSAIATKQDDADTLTFDATKTYVNSRGFLTTVATGDIVDGTITGDDINSNLAGSGLVLTAGTPDVLDFAPSELLNITFGNGSSASGSITFNLNGTTDPAITFTDGVVNVSAGSLQEGGSNVFTAADGSLSDDDLSNNSINDLNDVTITTAAAAQILVRNAGNTAWENVALAGDATITAAGALAVGADKILESMLKAVNAAVDEDILTFESTTGDFEWHTPSELGLQPLEATLTDIADGTIDENLVNTANPWAVNEGGTGAATFTLNGVLYGNTTSAIQATAQGGANTVLTANSGAPSFSGQPTLATGIVTKGQNAVEIDPYGAAAGNTGEIRALELAATGTNYVAFKAPDALAATTTYMLPRKGGATTGMVLHINATQDSLYWDTDDGAGGGAPIDATYITQTTNGSLTNEQALASLATGIMASTTTTGVIATRTLTGTAGAIEITSGDGSGNPTFTLPAAITVPTSYAIGADPADAGVVRLENAAVIAWEASPAAGDITLSVDASEIMQVGGALNATTLTEGTNAVPNATDHLGFFSATTSAQLFGVLSDETGSAIGSPLAVFNQNPTLAGATVNGGNISLNDGVGDSPMATLTPATGTAWNVFAQDADDDLQIQSANTAAAETVVMTNPGTGAVNFSVEGTIGASNFSGSSSGTNTGDQTITLQSDVTGSGTSTITTTISSDAVTNAKAANMAQNTIKMRVTTGAGDPEDIDISTGLTLVTAASGDYVVIEDATDGGLKRVDVANFLGGGVAWDAIGDATVAGSIGFAGFDQDIVSAEDGGDILTVTNGDAVHAATSRILVLADNDGANANAVYLQMIGDADGTPTNDYVFSQTGFTSLLAVNVPAEAYDATNWDADAGAPQKDAVRDQLEGYTGRNTIVTVGTIATGTWNATVIDEGKLDLTLTTTALNASGVTTTLGTVAGTIDAGGATALEIPNAANPTTSGEGQIAWDSNNDAIEVYNGTDSRILAIRIKSIQATIVDPDVVQPIIDAVSIFSVETEMFPFGITLISCGIKTDASSTYSVNFEEWTSPTDGAPSTIETVATATSTEAEDDGTLTDASIAAGSIIKVDLPTTNIAELVIWITYVINEGN